VIRTTGRFVAGGATGTFRTTRTFRSKRTGRSLPAPTRACCAGAPRPSSRSVQAATSPVTRAAQRSMV
jgi:hypothetical protein